MQEYISYDEALEERIRADREVQVVVDKLVAHGFAAWSRLSGQSTAAHAQSSHEAGLEDAPASKTGPRAKPGPLR